MFSVSFKYGEEKRFDTLAKACNWAAKQFENNREWAQRYNPKALEEIERCREELTQLKESGVSHSARFSALIDDLSGVESELTIVNLDQDHGSRVRALPVKRSA